MSNASPATANLQLTVKQSAKLLNISERLIYMARELFRTGREDLIKEIDAGRLTVLGALKIAKPEKYRRSIDRLDRLTKAWDAATIDEREFFLEVLLPECAS